MSQTKTKQTTSITTSQSEYDNMTHVDGVLYLIDNGNGVEKVYNGNQVIVESQQTMINTTYSELKTLRDNAQLVPRQSYRITDYTCTTIQVNTSSANHIFDIIVTAIDASHLSEEAKAAHHEGDTYFSSSNLDAWQIWYCLDNSTTKFTWADTTNGKGVIYRMIDHNGNDCPYDFKNILFDNEYVFGINDFSAQHSDFSNSAANKNNIVKPFFDDTAQANLYKQKLNKIRFTGFQSTGSSAWAHVGNVINTNCDNIVISGGAKFNYIAENCTNITIGVKSEYNYIGAGCSTCAVDAYYKSSMFGGTYYGSYYNTLGKNCSRVYTSKSSYNTFDDNCSYIYIGKDDDKNYFGKGCNYVTFGTGFSNTGRLEYVRNIKVKEGTSYVELTTTQTTSDSNHIQNIVIDNSCSGTNISSGKTTLSVSVVNQNYEINFAKNSQGVPKQWTPADLVQ